MKNKQIQVKKLAQYTAASAAFLSVQQDAEAQVVYRDLDPDSTITSNDTILLDINLDAVNDVMFWIESVADTIVSLSGESITYSYRFARADAMAYNALVGDEGTNSGYVFRNASQFTSGELIGYDNPEYFQGSAFLAGAVKTNGIAYYSGGPWSGSEALLGVRFKFTDGYNHWAWVRLSVGTGGSFITVKDLAYVNEADIAIPAGSTTDIEHQSEQVQPIMYGSGNHLQIIMPAVNQPATYKIFDIIGKEMQTGSCAEGANLINCSNLLAGIYIVRVDHGNNVYAEKMYLGEK
jgi:hypothetical protein